MRSKQTNTGFTIIELLIVIVVIAILAAITAVAYNGIQQRARNTQTIAGVNAYVKAIESYKALNDSYPTSNGCLGANYPNGNCWTNNGVAERSVNTTLDTLLSEFVSSKPTLATTLLYMHTTYYRAGLTYWFSNASYIQLRYYLDGNSQNCSVGGFTAVNEGNLTNCSKVISN